MPCHVARQYQTSEVRTGDEQDKSNRAQQHWKSSKHPPEGWLTCLMPFAQRKDFRIPSAVELWILLCQQAEPQLHFSLRVLEFRSLTQTAKYGERTAPSLGQLFKTEAQWNPDIPAVSCRPEPELMRHHAATGTLPI